MLHEETVEAGTLDLIKKLSADHRLDDFVLVGGTALSLQIGHRKSIDIDLFTTQPFDSDKMANHINSTYRSTEIQFENNAVSARVNGVKIDMIRHGYDWLKPLTTTDGIRMASLEDIGAMKLNAIVGNGSRLKDYVDMYYLLESKDLNSLINAYVKKYPDTNMAIARNALLYHSEIKFNTYLKLLHREFNWNEMVKRFKAAVVEPTTVFKFRQRTNLDLQTPEERILSSQREKGRRM
jgi:Nucleotidyl transferase AbiEii toxin, Type IV TA system